MRSVSAISNGGRALTTSRIAAVRLLSDADGRLCFWSSARSACRVFCSSRAVRKLRISGDAIDSGLQVRGQPLGRRFADHKVVLHPTTMRRFSTGAGIRRRVGFHAGDSAAQSPPPHAALVDALDVALRRRFDLVGRGLDGEAAPAGRQMSGDPDLGEDLAGFPQERRLFINWQRQFRRMGIDDAATDTAQSRQRLHCCAPR